MLLRSEKHDRQIVENSSDVIIGGMRDIPEHKQVEQELRESEERLHQIASVLHEAIWLWDVNTRQVLYVRSG